MKNNIDKMVELNKSASTEEFHIDLHGSPNKFIRLAIKHMKVIVNMF